MATELRPSVIQSTHCQQTNNPVQYLLNSAAHKMYRKRLKSDLLPEYFKTLRSSPPTLIIRKSTFRPDIIIVPLLLKDPYMYATINNNVMRTQQKLTPGGCVQ